MILVQRITQMNVIPDLLPHIDPGVDVSMNFGRRNVRPGDFVDSRVSEMPISVNAQVFDKGERLVTVAVVDLDVPNLEKDGFDYRCHYLAVNVPLTPSDPALRLRQLPTSQVMFPWMPPFAQKGTPYHRLSVVVLQQPEGKSVDPDVARAKVERDGFNLRSFGDKFALKPVGISLFRTQWDEGTAGVMQRAGIEGSDVEFRRKKVEPLPYKKKNPERYR